MISSHLYAWAQKTQRRRIVLQVVGTTEGRSPWRAEAIDEHGSTVGLTLDGEPDLALQKLNEAFARAGRS